MSEALDNKRYCPRCDTWQLAPDFLSPDGTTPKNHSNWCRACRQEKRNAERAKEKRVQMVAFASAIERRNIQQLSAMDLAERMLAQWGGLDEFCSGWFGQIKAAAANKPGGRDVLTAYAAVGKLITAAAASQPQINDLDLMSEDELKQRLVERLTELAPRLGSIEVESEDAEPADNSAED